MYRIRFHGRGGQGMKTASRILGTAFFRQGFEVQDAPRYGAERRGAPVFAYVRAAREPIHERGVIRRPDLVVVADDTLVPVPAAGVLAGVDADSVLLLSTHVEAAEWRRRVNVDALVLVLPPPAGSDDPLERRFTGAACAGAAARLSGVITSEALVDAVEEELAALGVEAVRRNTDTALEAFETMAAHAGAVRAGSVASATDYRAPDWITLPFEDARVSAPAIHAAATSVEVRTGLWRTMRPVIDYDACRRCWWVCSRLCPDSAIAVNDEGYPEIDYDHCKGCMICVAQCPPHAIGAVPEAQARAAEEGSA